jgi:hypothetical protein
MTSADQRIIDTIAAVLEPHLFNEDQGYVSPNVRKQWSLSVTDLVLAALDAEHIALVDLPAQHFGPVDEGVIAEFRFGEYGNVNAWDDGRITVCGGGDDEMPLDQAREFGLAFLAAVIAGEESK